MPEALPDPGPSFVIPPEGRPARLLQLLLSADVEFRTGLAETVRGGGAVLAIKAAKSAVPALVPMLRAHRGRTLACRRSINFIPVS